VSIDGRTGFRLKWFGRFVNAGSADQGGRGWGGFLTIAGRYFVSGQNSGRYALLSIVVSFKLNFVETPK
jgi:hypothetical protein